MSVSKKNKRLFLIAFVFLFFVILLGGIGFVSYNIFFQSNSGEDEAAKIMRAVEKHMILPFGTPTLATVSDITKLADKPLFLNAQNGDKVLIYSTEGKAILYRPSIDKVINVGPVVINQPTSTASAANPPSAFKIAEVIILNGSSTVGLARRAEEEVGDVNGIKVIDVDSANATSYKETIVAVNNKSVEKQAKDLASKIKGTVGTLPKDERGQNADIVVIVGSSYAKLQ